MSDSEEKIISLRISMPEELKNEFKAICARQGANMSEVIVKFVKGYIAEYGYSVQPKSSATTKPTAATKQGRGKGKG
ncbi:plasmid partition protein ParG [Microcoleus sp. MON2_D6]|uniref:plasmid partition protein ParG n=1 Tax=unclassified Microcoleus TaxID=2642155 RepID=UPI002FD18BAE